MRLAVLFAVLFSNTIVAEYTAEVDVIIVGARWAGMSAADSLAKADNAS